MLRLALLGTAAVQGVRLYYYWQDGNLARMTFWGAEPSSLPYSVWIIVVVLPLVLYGLLGEATRSAAGRGAAPGGAPEEEPKGALFRLIAHLKEQEKELRRHHRLARESAERQEQFNDKILSSIESALLTIDTHGRVITFNPAAERLFKQRAETVLGQPYREVFARSPQLAALIAGSLTKDVSYRRQEFLIADWEGQIRHVGAAVAPIKPDEGPAAGVLCLLTDLTEIVELQQHLKLKDNLVALGEMSAGIAHEFKNALATIGGYAQLIAREAQQSEVQEYNAVIRAEVAALTQIVSNFVDFAKPSPLVLEEIDLGELVENGVRDLATEEQFGHVRWDVAGNFGAVRGDRVLLKQALQNLLRNAAEAIALAADDGGEGHVRIQGRVESQGPRKQCILEIEDTGVGVAEADLEKIFLPFFTTKANGTGLGLAIVQKTIVHHNGHIAASRRSPGPGMRFTLSLPSI